MPTAYKHRPLPQTLKLDEELREAIRMTIEGFEVSPASVWKDSALGRLFAGLEALKERAERG